MTNNYSLAPEVFQVQRFLSFSNSGLQQYWIFIIPKLEHPIQFNLERDLDISKQTLLLFDCSHAVSSHPFGPRTKEAVIIGKDISLLIILSITEINSKISEIPFAFSHYISTKFTSLQGEGYAHVQEMGLARVSNSPPLAICNA